MILLLGLILFFGGSFFLQKYYTFGRVIEWTGAALIGISLTWFIIRTFP